MGFIFRLFLAIYSFCMAVISAAVILITFRQDIFNGVFAYYRDNIFTNIYSAFIAAFISLIFFISSLYFFISSLKTSRDKRAVSKRTSIGEIKISLNSVENIALAVARKIAGVKDIKASVTKKDDSVSINMKIIVFPDINIPALSEEIQMRVKNVVEENAGVNVNEVKVIVDNIYTGVVNKLKVERLEKTGQ